MLTVKLQHTQTRMQQTLSNLYPLPTRSVHTKTQRERNSPPGKLPYYYNRKKPQMGQWKPKRLQTTEKEEKEGTLITFSNSNTQN